MSKAEEQLYDDWDGYNGDANSVLQSIPEFSMEETEEEPIEEDDDSDANKFDMLLKSVDDIDKASSSKIRKELQEVIQRFLKEKVPSKDELQEFVTNIQQNMKSAFDSVVNSLFKQTYDESVQEVERELDLNVEFGRPDREALRALRNSPVLSQSFSGLQQKVTDKIHEIMNEAYANPEQLTINEIQRRIQDVADVAAYRAENIARTESGKVSSAARRATYEKTGELDNMLFEWIGPADNRTHRSCMRIMQRTKGGVLYDELINIIQEEVRNDFPEWTVDPNAPLAHYQCRHTFVRVQ